MKKINCFSSILNLIAKSNWGLAPLKTILIVIGILLSSTSWAHHGVSLGELALGGNGCPKDGDQYLYFGPMSGRLILVLWDYDVEVDGSKIARKSCNMSLPFQVEKGKKIVVKDPAMGGRFDLTANSELSLKMEVFLDSESSHILRDSILFEDGNQDRFYLRDEGVILESQCGETGILRMNSSALVKNKVGVSKNTVRSMGLTITTEDCK